jgi:hypothetical protein
MHVETSCASSYVKRNSSNELFAGSRQHPITDQFEYDKRLKKSKLTHYVKLLLQEPGHHMRM